MYSFHQNDKDVSPEKIARLLRSVGASGRLVGFNYIVYIVYNILQKPDEHYWIKKALIPMLPGIFMCAHLRLNTRYAQ